MLPLIERPRVAVIQRGAHARTDVGGRGDGVVGVAAGATPASAASDGKARCIQEAAKAGLLSGDINPGTVNFVGGTDGDDTFTGTDGVDFICGFGGNDSVTPSPRETSFSAAKATTAWAP